MDEDLPPYETTCGIGACAANGTWRCADGVASDDCAAGMPGDEVCNGIDDDCDGEVDGADIGLRGGERDVGREAELGEGEEARGRISQGQRTAAARRRPAGFGGGSEGASERTPRPSRVGVSRRPPARAAPPPAR